MDLGPLLLLLLTSAAITNVSAVISGEDLVSELISLRSRSSSGVIHLDDRLVSRFLSSAPNPRPYSVVLFFDASQLRDKPDLHLPQLRSEFSLLSHSFLEHNSESDENNKLFFCEIEFTESQHSFSLFGVNSLPHVRYISPETASLHDSVPFDQAAFSRLAESMAEFVESKSGFRVNPIVRPPPISRNQIIFLLICFLAALPFMIKKVIEGDTLLHDKRMWMAGAVFVYFFSVGGTMHNIIRKMPMFLVDRGETGRLVFFYQGSGMQLGAEGFAVGFLYTVVGLLLAFVMHFLVNVKSVKVQRWVMFGAMFVSYLAVNQVIYLDNWKTGYSIHAFWPNRWR